MWFTKFLLKINMHVFSSRCKSFKIQRIQCLHLFKSFFLKKLVVVTTIFLLKGKFSLNKLDGIFLLYSWQVMDNGIYKQLFFFLTFSNVLILLCIF